MILLLWRGLSSSVNLRMLISSFFMLLGLPSWKCQTLSVKEDKLPQTFIARCWAAHGLFRKARASGFENGWEGRKTVLLEAQPKPPWGSNPARIPLLLPPESLPMLALSPDIRSWTSDRTPDTGLAALSWRLLKTGCCWSGRSPAPSQLLRMTAPDVLG